MIVFLSVLAVGMVSAADNTFILGKIYNSPDFQTAKGVVGATVSVTCNTHTINVTSQVNGTYSVEFASDLGCVPGDTASAFATIGNTASNTQTGVIHSYSNNYLDIFLGVINIALVPEFTAGIGLLTLVSAVGIFFFVRRK